MGAFQSLNIRQYRGLQNVEIRGMGRLNLLTGYNGSGKTALLEAMFLLSAPDKPELSVAVMNFRGIERVGISVGDMSGTPWDSLFPYGAANKSVSMSGVTDVGLKIEIDLRPTGSPRSGATSPTRGPNSATTVWTSPGTRNLTWSSRRGGGKRIERTVSVSPSDDGVLVNPPGREPQWISAMRLFNARTKMSVLAERLGLVELAGMEDFVVESLRIIDPRVRRLTTIVNSAGPSIHVDLGLGQLMPVGLMGGGFLSLLEILLDMQPCRDGVILIDEIENGFHHSIMANVWRVIADAAERLDTQVVATTHSLEFIKAAHEAHSAQLFADLNVFRIQKRSTAEAGSEVVRYDAETLTGALELGLEVR